MKRFKQLFAITASVICCALFIGCEVVYDDDYYRDEIVGRWFYKYQDGNYEFEKELYFSSMGTYTMEINEYKNGYWLDDYYESGSYYIGRWGELELTYEDRGYVYTDFYDYDIRYNTMTLDYYDNGSYYSEEYNRY